MNHFRRILPGAFVAIFLVFLTPAAVTHAVANVSPNCGSWVPSSSPSPASFSSSLNGVAAVSANNIWAVGYYTNFSTVNNTLIEHWNGSSWSIVSSPNVGTFNDLEGVARVPGTIQVWTVGTTLVGAFHQPLIELWNGFSWSVIANPSVGSGDAGLGGVIAFSATNAWAVGSYTNSSNIPQPLIEHWNGSGWNVVPGPTPGTGGPGAGLSGVTAISANNIWAVGSTTDSSFITNTLVEHWNGVHWSVIPSANPGTPGNILFSVTRVPGSAKLWAVGYYFTSSTSSSQTLIEFWNGSNWSVVSSPFLGPAQNSFSGVAAVAANNVWAVGNYIDSSGNQQTLIEQWNGSSWNIVTSPMLGSPTLFSGITRVPGSTQVWAVGFYYNTSISNDQTLIAFNC